MLRTFFTILILMSIGACTQRPVVDLALADVAIKAAQKARADSLATDQFRQAENFYLRAKKDFNEGYFDSCKKFANQARILAEQAEYHSLLKQNQVKSKTDGKAPLPGSVPGHEYQGNPNYPGPEGPE